MHGVHTAPVPRGADALLSDGRQGDRRALMSSGKVRTGISFDFRLLEALDASARELEELQVTRSELANAILDDYFETGRDAASVRENVVRRRVGAREDRAARSSG